MSCIDLHKDSQEVFIGQASYNAFKVESKVSLIFFSTTPDRIHLESCFLTMMSDESYRTSLFSEVKLLGNF